jgi:hypothetical protein
MKDFALFEQALELKQLGFDEPHYGLYGKSEGQLFKLIGDKFDKVDELHFIKAPLYQQAFRWFRETFNLHSNISSWRYDDNLSFYHEFEIYDFKGCWVGDEYSTYGEAELECLRKLIKIVKENKI